MKKKSLYPQCSFLELVHGPELLQPVENDVVERRIRCISVFFDPWVICQLKSTELSGHVLSHKIHATGVRFGRVLTEDLEGCEPLLGVDVKHLLDKILGA